MTMRRVLSGAERSATQGSRDSYYRFRVTNPDGTWLNLGALSVNGTAPKNFNNTATIAKSIDENTLQMTATVRREIGNLSLAPLKTDSPLNATASFLYAPALDLRRRWVLEVAVMPHEVKPAAANFRPLAEGIITTLDITGDRTTGVITISGRGMETALLKTEQLTEQQYDGAPIADRLQAMLNRWNTGVTLTVDGSAPSYFVNAATAASPQPVGSLMPALAEISSLPGAAFRYMYDAADVNRLTLFTPNRNPTAPDWVLGPREYRAIPGNRLDLDAVRNYVPVTYIDEDFGETTVTSPSPEPSSVTALAGAATFTASPGDTIADGAVIVVAGVPYTVSDYDAGAGTATLSGAPTFDESEWVTSASITRYGLLPLPIGLAQTTNISTQEQAGALADAVRADWELPALEQQIETEGGWFLELYDYLELLPNGTHYNTSQFGGVVSVTHTFSGGRLITTVGLRGKPAGGYRSWLSFGSNAPRKPLLPEVTVTGTFQDSTEYVISPPQLILSITMKERCQSVLAEWFTDQALTVPWRTPVAWDRAANGQQIPYPEGLAGDFERNVLYWYRVTPYSGPQVTGIGLTGIPGTPEIGSVYAGVQMTPQTSFDLLQGDVDTLTDDVADLADYIDAKVAGLSWKQAVRAATTVAGTLASSFENGDAIDGVTLATGDRILVKNQAAASENGIYTVNASGAPTRATDADSGAELVNASLYVSEGTTNADTQWTCTTNAPITLGSTSLAFAQMSTGNGLPAATPGALAYYNGSVWVALAIPADWSDKEIAGTPYVLGIAGAVPSWRVGSSALVSTVRDHTNDFSADFS